MGWTSTYWKSADDIEDGYPISVNISCIVDSINESGLKFCWTVLGDYLVKAGTTYIEGINNDHLKFIWNTNLNTYGLPISAQITHNILTPAACRGLTNLTSVTIPPSVKYIDYLSFLDTGLTSVTIADDCVYQDSSFPTGCVINRYS